ncbi:aminoglycoside phosphotransferase family protein [Nocardia huaxiensis]|uniref:Aminoglycoside phosphotransferase family protein n=3 Tax=Nocardia huaxiensis TaxID=2755382 RepID=A0A7D6VBN9_9NOCA|nr:aminoglycoside phosphotransferase family protein [Nocardia huaxiensis]
MPELAEGRVRVLGAGMDSVALLVSGGAGEFVVRLPKGEDGAKGIAVEGRVLPELGEGLSVRIPRFAFMAANPLGPGECCVYPAVPGESLSDGAWRERGLLSDENAGVVARFIEEVHGFSVGRARELGVGERDMRSEFGEDLELVRAQVVPLLPTREGRRLLEVWEGYLEGEANFRYEPAVMHADVSLDHLLVTGDRITGVIDFGDLQIGDPDYDLCYLWTDAGAEFVGRVQDRRGKTVDAVLRGKLDFWACSDSAIDVLHAIEHDMPEFREESVRNLRAALGEYGGQAGTL